MIAIILLAVFAIVGPMAAAIALKSSQLADGESLPFCGVLETQGIRIVSDGQTRAELTLDPSGMASLVFYDQSGKEVHRVPGGVEFIGQ